MTKTTKKQTVLGSLTLALLLSQTACDTNSSVEFKGDRATLGQNTNENLASQIVTTDGGFLARRTPSNYQTSLTIGSQLSGATATTSGGYKVQLNFEGQMAK